MLQPLRKYLLKKSWNRQFTPKMTRGNVFAFGKKKEDRLHLVTYPYFFHALNHEDNVIWMSEGGLDDAKRALEEYRGLQGDTDNELNADEYEFLVVDLDKQLPADEYDTYCDDVIARLRTEKIILVFKMSQWKERDVRKELMATDEGVATQLASLNENIAARLYMPFYYFMERICATMTEESYMPTLSIVMHDVCGNICIDPMWLRTANTTTCITMDTHIGHKWWRDRVGANVAVVGYTANIKSLSFNSTMVGPAFSHTASGITPALDINWKMDTDSLFRDFFFCIQTVLCLGADDLNPAEHKRFVGQCMFNTAQVGVGGKYAIEEINTYAERACHRAVRNESLLCKGDIPDNVEDHRIYGNICNNAICAGKWIVEFNNRIRLHYADGVYFPAVFHNWFTVVEWAHAEAFSTEIDLEDGDEISGDFLLSGTDKDGQPITISVMKIKDEAMAEKFRDMYLVGVLEMGEAESVLDYNRERLGIEDGYSLTLQKEILADFVCRHGLGGLIYPEAETVTTESTSEDPSDETPPFEIPEEYRWKPYMSSRTTAEDDENENEAEDTIESIVLPETGVLFLGGHQNMTNKLKQLFPKWAFMSDDLFYKGTGQYEVVFFWNKHCSHSMVEFVQARTKTARLVYVASTNIARLIREMKEGYAKAAKEPVLA